MENPAQTEQEWLDALDRESPKFMRELTAMLPAGRAATVAELQAAVDYAHRVEDQALSIKPTASALSALGFDRLARRVDEELARIRTSRETCENMLLDRIAAQQAAFGAQPAPVPAARVDPPAWQVAADAERKRRQAEFDAWMTKHKQQEAEHDAQFQAWSDRFNGKKKD
jgi:hypothetical protein